MSDYTVGAWGVVGMRHGSTQLLSEDTLGTSGVSANTVGTWGVARTPPISVYRYYTAPTARYRQDTVGTW